MRLINVISVLILAITLTDCSNTKPDDSIAQEKEIYQLKIYTFANDQQQQVTEKYLKEAFLQTLNTMGISPVGIFKNKISETDSTKRIFVLLPFSSLAQFEELERSLNTHDNYLTLGNEYLNAPFNNPPYARMETILLLAFKDMPKLRPSPLTNLRKDRIYELRSYESATEKTFANKVDMFNAGGEITLFEKLKFNAVFYGEVISGPKMPNLMYMTTHADSATREANWKNFVDSPEWKEMSSLEKYQNNVSHIDITFLYPTNYSEY